MQRGGRPGMPLRPEYAALGEWIKAKREEAGLGQKATARKLGHHEQWLHRIEKGTQRIDVVDFMAFLKVIGVDSKTVYADLAKALSPRRK